MNLLRREINSKKKYIGSLTTEKSELRDSVSQNFGLVIRAAVFRMVNNITSQYLL